MTLTRRTIAILMLSMLLVAAFIATVLQSPQNATETAAKAGGVVAVVADAKAKVAE